MTIILLTAFCIHLLYVHVQLQSAVLATMELSGRLVDGPIAVSPYTEKKILSNICIVPMPLFDHPSCHLH